LLSGERSIIACGAAAVRTRLFSAFGFGPEYTEGVRREAGVWFFSTQEHITTLASAQDFSAESRTAFLSFRAPRETKKEKE
jgi:hypothetical protein